MAKIISDRRVYGSKLEEDLQRKKTNVKDSYNYFKENYKRFNKFRRFVFQSTLSDEERNLNLQLGKPTLEFNIVEAYISHLRGEFAQQEPSLEVRMSDDAQIKDARIENILESHLRAILFESNRDNMQFDIYTDILSGGFSAIKVYTEYSHEMSFDQVIRLRRVFDPTLCGFDKMARDSHKGDGMYCFEMYPMTREDFECQYGTKATEKMSFLRDAEGFNWSYSTMEGKEIVLVADYYEKKVSKAKIVKLINGQTMLEKDYERFVAQWNDNPDIFLQAPAVIGKPRVTEFVQICQSILVENETIEYNETDFKYLPLIFVDGNSIQITQDNGSTCQMTRPYVYNAESIQKLKNYAGNSLANELENLIMSKIMMPEEGIPAEYKDAYINPQKHSIYIYKAYKDQNGQVALPPPQAVPQPRIPPELTQTFGFTDEMTQAILGSYHSAMITNDKDLSGKAIIESASQSNATAMPFLVNYMKSLNRAAEIIVDLIPKYITTPRNIQIKDLGSRKIKYQRVNDRNSPSLNYPPNAFQVKIEAGPNFAAQQQKAFNTLIQLMQVNPIMAAYMGEEQGLQTLLDNIDIRGVDALKQGIAEFSQKQKQMQAKMQQSQMQSAQMPIMIKQAELKQQAEKIAMEYDINNKKVAIQEQDADTRRLVGLATIGEKADKAELEEAKIDAEKARTLVSSVNAIANIEDAEHQKAMDILNLHHTNDRHAKDLAHAAELSKSEISSRLMPQ